MRLHQSSLLKALLICVILLMHNITKAQLHVGFTASLQAGCSPLLVKFTDTSNGQPTKWKWQFGNGIISTEKNPSTTYFEPGTYTVKLVVSNITGADSIEKISYITIYDKPHLSFALNDVSGCNPHIVSFDDQSSPGSGTIANRIWDFGDGNLSTELHPSHTYTGTGIFDVTLKITNSYGCISGETKSDAVHIEGVTTDFDFNIPDECHAASSVKFTDNSFGTGLLNYAWTFGDGSTSTAITPEHNYVTDGSYDVKLKVQNAYGCFDTISKQVVITSKHSSFSTAGTLCAKTSSVFQNTSEPTPISATWTFGDGTTSSRVSPSKTYNQTGTFEVTVVNRFFEGCLDTATSTIFVNEQPTTFFTTRNNLKGAISISNKIVCRKQKVSFNIKNVSDSSNIKLPYTVNFDNRSTGTDNSYEWDFGDGTKSIEKNPSHTYNQYGNFAVTLQTTNSGGCTDIYSITDCIVIQPQTLITSNASNIISTKWNFGEGNGVTAQGTSTDYSYHAAGSYRASAIVRYENGNIDTLFASDTVIVHGPKARFSMSEKGGCINSTIHFSDATPNSDSDAIVYWSWDFGDSTKTDYTSSKSDYSHQYIEAGLFDVQLQIRNTYGCEDSISKQVLITNPYAFFETSDTLICPGNNVDFVNKSVGKNLKYSWNLGDGVTLKDFDYSHVYSKKGSYLPSVEVTDINGCKSTFVIPKPIIVSSPKVNFNLSDTFSTCPPLVVDFTNKSSSYTSLLWSFGDGSTSTLVSPKHIYTYPGIYQTKIVVSSEGCSDSLTKNITIKGPRGKLLYNAASICQPEISTFKVKSENAKNYVWDYADGKTFLTESDSVSHRYAPGFYIPKIILSDASGCKVAITGTDTIKVFTVTAKAILKDQIACDSNKIFFEDSSFSNDLIKSQLWNFGDNTSAVGRNVAHPYSQSSTYKITLISYTQHGCSDTFEVTKSVKLLQSSAVTINADSVVCEKNDLTVHGDVKDRDVPVTNWVWNFDNGVTSSGQNPAPVNYAHAGIYNLVLTAVNSDGCSSKASKRITVPSSPRVDAGPDTVICKNASYTFKTSGANEYAWTSNPDLSCTNCSSPVIHPDSSSRFYVTGKDKFGCSATDSVLVSVIQPLHITSSIDTAACYGQSIQLFANGAHTYQWFPSTYLNNANVDKPVLTPLTDGLLTYTVVGKDAKNCFSDTGVVQIKIYALPKIELSPRDITLAMGTSVHLMPKSSADAVRWHWFPQQGLDNALVQDPIASPQQTTTYNVEAVTAQGCAANSQVTVHVLCNNSNLFVPNTFSPNNDGMNDFFYVRGTGLSRVKSFRIFNRLGQILFERTNIAANNASSGWDGTFHGEKMPADVYICAIELLCENGNVLPVKQSITLIR
jgi:gliding motility-associated-like protein